MGVDENLVIDEAVFQEKRRHGLADVSVVGPVALLSGDGDIDRDLRLAGPGGGNDALIDLIFHRSGQMPVQLQRVGVGKGKKARICHGIDKQQQNRQQKGRFRPAPDKSGKG